MKLAVTAKTDNLDSRIDPRFGRAPYFLIIDADTLDLTALANPNTALGGGAGIQSAQLMAEHDVEAVLTGNCGPNAYRTLEAADIEVVTGVTGAVRDAVQHYNSGALQATDNANVGSHFGMGRGGGKGGGGGGLGHQMPVAQAADSKQLAALQDEAARLDAQLQDIRSRIQQASGTDDAAQVAAVDSDVCTACGVCADACPQDAITIDDVAQIDAATCTGCGACIDACPAEAILLQSA